MDAKLFAQMLADKKAWDLRRMQYKYSAAAVTEFVELLKIVAYRELPLKDCAGAPVVYQPKAVSQSCAAIRTLHTPENSPFAVQAMQDEIQATLNIEQIRTSRHSIRRILQGFTPADHEEERLLGMKRGLDFISCRKHIIDEYSLHTLYDMVISDFLDADDKLLPDQLYRHAAVYVSDGPKDVHTGLKAELLPAYIKDLMSFIQQEDDIDDLSKAALIHAYFAYIHPYFDGNGRMARLLHQWYLVQRGYASTLFVSFSRHIDDSRTQYYKAFRQVEENRVISKVLDMTPLVSYFAEHVYARLERPARDESATAFSHALAEGKITVKEKALWEFVCTTYGKGEFSTKQLEKDNGNAAYATVRTFVLKFTELGLLAVQRYGGRKKYRIA